MVLPARLPLLLLVFTSSSALLAHGKVTYKTECSDSEILVRLKRTDDIKSIYLEGLKYYPDESCKPELHGHEATFRLPLDDIYKCGITRIINQANGLVTYYHRVVIEMDQDDAPKEYLQVKCLKSPSNHTLVRRNVLPAGFQEPMDVTITSSYVREAPQPKLSVGVRQSGQLVNGELNVSPGTPLQMEIYLDEASAPIYGLLLSYMTVTDTKSQEETIIFNGCSVDPYLFENFNTVDGDFLTAKFRAFKFPDSTYVQFKGTVNVCLDKCQGVECSNGQRGYGRRKREIPSLPPDPNKVFEISITSFIKVDYKGENNIEKVKLDDGAVKKNTSWKEFEEIRTDGMMKLAVAGDEVTNEGVMKLGSEQLTGSDKEGFLYTLIPETSSAVSFWPPRAFSYLLATIATGLLVLR